MTNKKINPKDIFTGWKNFMDKSEVVEELAKERAETCSTCEFAKKGMLLSFIKDDIKEIEGYYCANCLKCPISAKIRSIEKCYKWKK